MPEPDSSLPSFLAARRAFVGVVHLAALPGAPRYGGAMEEVLRLAVRDAESLAQGGVDALIVENFGDVPFHPRSVPPETVAALTRAVAAVGRVAGDLPVGVNVLRNDGRAGLGICAATGASFVRVNVLAGAMVTDQGVLEGEAATLLRERARLAPAAAVLADVHVKHARPLAAEDLPRAALDTLERGLADAVIVSGTGTGSAPAREDLARVREAIGSRPLLVGSGATPEGLSRWGELIDGAIVGTWLKRDGRVENEVDPSRVRAVRDALA